ncbi:hypothetical protein [Oceanobacillus salinisoli]|uniref:hypothetical protein n=1 Tax=Oceanobacillus salinisoli TaxID=2678611 RepID=UPI0012E13D07|nr:hypothetical protein [Oceanobacillus salinisoli]
MDKKKSNQVPDTAQAPGIDLDDSYGKNATQEDKENKETTQVTRLVYDEYDASERN